MEFESGWLQKDVRRAARTVAAIRLRNAQHAFNIANANMEYARDAMTKAAAEYASYNDGTCPNCGHPFESLGGHEHAGGTCIHYLR